MYYSHLASRYRAQSVEKGLGLASHSYALSHSTSDDGPSQQQRGGDPSSIETTAGAAAGRGKTPDLDSLFAGSQRRRKQHAQSSAQTSHTSHALLPPRQGQAESSSSASSPKRATTGRHSSTRGYAKQRVKAQEALEDIIASATDTGRLKFEAKAALLSGSPALAVIILIRAAALGSVSACISLAALYTTGVIKGGKPVVALVHRQPLPALAWLLEGVRLLRRRREKNRSKNSGGALVNNFHNHKTTAEKDTLDQIIRTLALLERLLRTQHVASDLSSEADTELVLPDLQSLQTPVQRGALRSQPRPSSEPVSTPQMQLWPSVLETRLWLESELELLSPKITTSKAAESAGPDDDIITAIPPSVLVAHAQLHFVKALAQTHSICRNGVLEAKATEALAASWSAGKTSLSALNSTSDKEELLAVARCGMAFVDKLHVLADRNADAKQIKQSGAAFWTDVQQTLPERHVPLPPVRGSSTPGNRSPTPNRKKSLEDLAPVDVEAVKEVEAAQRPSLVKVTVSKEPAPPSLAVDKRAPTASGLGTQLQSPRKFLNRAISNAERPSASLLSSAPSSRSINRSRDADPSPSFAHHFGGRTISGSKLTVNARRPSSVVSDSPSLLFGEIGDDGDTSGHPRQGSDESGPQSAGIAFPSSATTHDLSQQAAAQPIPRRPGQAARGGLRRVTSMYGEPSLNTQTIHSSGTSSSAYGHVGPGGTFDPTASLREGQFRRRRADSNASVATGTSIFSTQAIRNEQSFSPPDGHAMGVMVSHGSGSISNGMPASDSLRSRLGGAGAPEPEAKSSMRERSESGTPLLTERLERKLAESYASQRHASHPGVRKDGQSINSRVSNASRRTGLSAFRSPSFFTPSTGGRKYHLGIFPKSTMTPSLATTSENVEQLLGKDDVDGGKKSAVTASPTATTKETFNERTLAAGKRRNVGSAKSAVNSLRAVSLNDATAKIAGSQRTVSGSTTTNQSRLPIPDFGSSSRSSTSPPSPASAPRAQGQGRAFASVDPTSHVYAVGITAVDAETASPSNASQAPNRTLTASPKPSIRSANSPRRVSPPGSVRSVRFDLDSAQALRVASRENTPPHSPRPNSYRSDASSSDLDPALARAERRSKLKTQAGCENCGVTCINAPVDRKGRKFCSRECRIEVKERDKAQSVDMGHTSPEPVAA